MSESSSVVIPTPCKIHSGDCICEKQTTEMGNVIVNPPHDCTVYKLMPCGCPTILVSDDDKFQNDVYIHKLTSYKHFEQEIEFNISGEDLLTKYLLIKHCGCQSIKLIITDFNMGSEGINGIELAVLLREAGYNKTLILRSGDSIEDINDKCTIKTFFVDGTIDFYFSKGNDDKFDDFILHFDRNPPVKV
jgi:CheY-like chemotaxis protein